MLQNIATTCKYHTTDLVTLNKVVNNQTQIFLTSSPNNIIFQRIFDIIPKKHQLDDC